MWPVLPKHVELTDHHQHASIEYVTDFQKRTSVETDITSDDASNLARNACRLACAADESSSRSIESRDNLTAPDSESCQKSIDKTARREATQKAGFYVLSHALGGGMSAGQNRLTHSLSPAGERISPKAHHRPHPPGERQ